MTSTSQKGREGTRAVTGSPSLQKNVAGWSFSTQGRGCSGRESSEHRGVPPRPDPQASFCWQPAQTRTGPHSPESRHRRLQAACRTAWEVPGPLAPRPWLAMVLRQPQRPRQTRVRVREAVGPSCLPPPRFPPAWPLCVLATPSALRALLRALVTGPTGQERWQKETEGPGSRGRGLSHGRRAVFPSGPAVSARSLCSKNAKPGHRPLGVLTLPPRDAPSGVRATTRMVSRNKGTMLGGHISGLPVRKPRRGQRPASRRLGCQPGTLSPLSKNGRGGVRSPPTARGTRQLKAGRSLSAGGSKGGGRGEQEAR